MAQNQRPYLRAVLLGSALFALTACDRPFDFDFRHVGNGLDTSDAALNVTADRPKPDDRGILSYPNYQVAVARKGDTIGDVAARVGLPAAELAQYNGLPEGVTLRKDEVIALPRRVAEPTLVTGAVTTGPIGGGGGGGGVDISTLAGDAISRSDDGSSAPAPAPATVAAPDTKEPIRHKIVRGETAFSIARLYNVSVRSLADWNGLGPDLVVREGQFLLIPISEDPPRTVAAAAPGQGSDTPQPPSAATALPDSSDVAVVAAPASPNLAADKTAASGTSKLLMPVSGKIIRGFVKKKNDGIDIAADAGTPVNAAADGTVAAITRDTDQVPILVLRHADNMLTVYAGVDSVKVQKGDTVKRGQPIAQIRAGNPSFLHFEVRQGFDSVDPVPFLN